MVTIFINNTKCKILGLKDANAIHEIDMVCSYQIQGYQFIRGNRNWDGRYRLFNKNHHIFSPGLLIRVCDILTKHRVPFNVVDKRPDIFYGDPMPKLSSKFEDRPYQAKAVERCIDKGSGIVKMGTGCHAKGTEILMYDGSIKLVENISIGDEIMGPDSRPRLVLELCRGRDRMIKIHPNRGGDSFIINQKHILSLKRTRKSKTDGQAGKIEDISFSKWERQTKYYKHMRKLYRVPVEFEKKALPIEPYFLGLYLGDGSTRTGSIGITSIDKETIEYLNVFADNNSFTIRKNGISYFLTSEKKTKNSNDLINSLRFLNLFGKKSDLKFVPHIYKTSDRHDRLEILAGLLDSDGSYARGGYDYISKSKQLSNDLAFIARSLGLSAHISKQKKCCTTNGYSNFYYRVSISGDCSIIPCKIKRKISEKRRQIKNNLMTGFSYEEAGFGEYFGFKVDKDHRYLLGNFTVTHNSGKAFVISKLVAELNVPTMIYVIGVDLLYQMKGTLEEAFGIDVGMIGDGHCDVKKINVATIWSAAAAYNAKIDIDDSDFRSDKKKIGDKKAIRNAVESAKMFILDECQYGGSKTFIFLNKNSKSAQHKFLFSGTPWREQGDDILLESVAGPKIVDVTSSELIKDKYLVKPFITFKDMPVKRKVGNNWREVYSNYIINNQERNLYIVDSTKKLLDAYRKPLILVKSLEHGRNLALDLEISGIKVSNLDGQKSSKKRKESILDMKRGDIDVIIASQIFDQGVDIPELDALILAGSGKSTARALQRIGRVIRKNEGKRNAIVLDFYDNCKYLRNHSQERYKIYATEPEFEIKRVK